MKKKLLFALSVSLFLSLDNVEAQMIDSLNVTSSLVTVGEPWFTDYFTGYSVYTTRSFFKDASGGLHVVFISNYKLHYCYSADGSSWTNEPISSIHDGDFREAVIYADSLGVPHIAATVNPYYDYGNPTSVQYGDEFRYSVYYYYKANGVWMEEEVFDSTVDPGFSGNYGCRVNELYRNMDGEMVLIGSRYGWYTYGGAFWEFTRDVQGVWSGLTMIHEFNDTPIDNATDLGRIYLRSNGDRDLIYTRPHNSNGIAELAYLSYTNGIWSQPTVLTTDMINQASWDLTISAEEDLYLIHYSNDPAPHVNMYTDLTIPSQLNVDLSLVNAIGAAKIHITEDGILDLLVYPVGSDTVILYASEDQGLTWSDPIFRERVEFPGVLPVSDQFSDQGSDLEFIRVSRPPSTQPYGPDSLFYGHIEQINSQSVGISHHASSVDRLLVHPNPFSGSVAIDCLLARSGRLNVRVFDIQGQLLTERIYSGTLGENRILMELGHLRQGTYLIEVIGSDRSGNQGYRSTVRLMKL